MQDLGNRCISMDFGYSDYIALQQSSRAEYYLVHHMPTYSRCAVMMLSINLRYEHSHLCSHNIAKAFRTLSSCL